MTGFSAKREANEATCDRTTEQMSAKRNKHDMVVVEEKNGAEGQDTHIPDVRPPA